MKEILHASAVASDGRAVLILGQSGTGKSGLAINLIALGCRLVSDDRVIATAQVDGPPHLAPPAELAGRIEARGLGILHADWTGGVPVAFAVDLGVPAGSRLPPPRTIELCGAAVPLLWAQDVPNLVAGVFLALKGGLETHG